jgi:HK97 family phage portal protein
VGFWDFFKWGAPTLASSVAEQRSSGVGVQVSTEESNARLFSILGLAGGSVAGVSVNQHSVMTLTAVWACVNDISQDIAGLPVKLIQEQGDKLVALTGRKVTRLLNLQASPLLNSFQFRQLIVAFLLLRGNAYAVIRRDALQEPNQLDWKHPDETDVFKHNGRLWYKFSGDPKVYADYEVLHFKGLSLDGMTGVSALHYHRETFGKALSARRSSTKFYENNAKSKLALETDQKLKPETIQLLRDTFAQVYAGPENAGRPLILEEGMKARPLTLTPADAQYIEEANLTVADVGRIFRMPPHKMGDLSRSTNNNIEQQSQDYVGDTLMPLINNQEQELRLKLLPTYEVETTKFKHNVSALLRADHASRAAYYGKMTDIGAYTINDVLALEDRNGIGPEGDRRFVQVNRMPLDRVDDMIDRKQNTPQPQEDEGSAAA